MKQEFIIKVRSEHCGERISNVECQARRAGLNVVARLPVTGYLVGIASTEDLDRIKAIEGVEWVDTKRERMEESFRNQHVRPVECL